MKLLKGEPDDRIQTNHRISRIVLRFLWDYQKELTERAEQYKFKNGQDEYEGYILQFWFYKMRLIYINPNFRIGGFGAGHKVSESANQ